MYIAHMSNHILLQYIYLPLLLPKKILLEARALQYIANGINNYVTATLVLLTNTASLLIWGYFFIEILCSRRIKVLVLNTYSVYKGSSSYPKAYY